MKDPFGTALLIIRNYASIAAIVGDVDAKVTTIAAEPPAVRLRAGATTREAFGPGSGRVGVQLWAGVAQCYGPDDETGPIVARQLAGEVSDAFHGIGAHRGSNGNFILRAWAPLIDEIARDPDTEWPYHTVRITAFAATEAVA